MGSSRNKIARQRPQSSGSQSDNDGDDNDAFSDTDMDPDDSWTASDQQHVEDLLKTKEGRSVRLPVTPAMRARRLLVPPDDRCPLAAVYMRGDTQFIHKTRL